MNLEEEMYIVERLESESARVTYDSTALTVIFDKDIFEFPFGCILGHYLFPARKPLQRSTNTRQINNGATTIYAHNKGVLRAYRRYGFKLKPNVIYISSGYRTEQYIHYDYEISLADYLQVALKHSTDPYLRLLVSLRQLSSSKLSE